MNNGIFTLLISLATALSAQAAALLQDTNVHSRPDATSTVIARLRAGVESAPPPALMTVAPAGWMAVELEGPFDVFVANADVTKALDVREGAPLLLEPRAGAPALAVMQKGDKAEISGLRGRFTGIKLEKTVVGFIRVGTGFPATALPPPAATPAPPTPGMAPYSPSVNVSPVSDGAAAQRPLAGTIGSPVGQPVPPPAAAAQLPRILQGRFASSQRPFTPRRPYDYQIDDDAGVRIAYVDLSGLMLTEQIDRYVGRVVVVTGIAENSLDARAVVIKAESLILK